jgi:hypothetical protein
MHLSKNYWTVILAMAFVITSNAQRNYAAHSVLASGNWYKIGITKQGVYKIDVNFLTNLGISVSNLASSSIRLYGNGGAMLAENNAVARIDDLAENAIQVVDGGDGIFNNNDYFLFYAAGPDQWTKDSLNQNFLHTKNLYSDTAYYFITIGGTGKRITTLTTGGAYNIAVNSFDDHFFYENELINFLNSGKEWYGEAFSNNTGGIAGRNFSVDFSGLITTQPLVLKSAVAGRSIGSSANFSVSVNGQSVQTIPINSVSGYYLDAYAVINQQNSSFFSSSSALSINYQYNAVASGASGWLNWFEISGRKSLAFNNTNCFFFRDWKSVAANNMAAFTISNAISGCMVWEITNPLVPQLMNTSYTNTQLSFVNDASRLREYAAFNLSGTIAPVALGKIPNQDLHNSSAADLIIITYPDFATQAKRLADFHTQHDGYTVTVVPTQQIFTEFASGNADPTALRDFIKMYFDKAGNDSSLRPKYVLLFGASSYDYKSRIKNNTNFVACYESDNATDPLSTYVSDDFFGLLNDNDDVNNSSSPALLDIGIGRLPARNIAEATTMVDKIINYHSSKTLGAWRNQSVFTADNGDMDLHLNDAEFLSTEAGTVNPLFNQQKIYLDAYKMVSGSGGTRFPEVNTAIINNVYNGTLFFNYTGHGGYQQLSGSAVLTQTELQQFNNTNKLPLFITATCDFAPYDDPAKNSLGGSLLYQDSTGAIALLTTTRPVFASSNKTINDQYIKTALQQDALGTYFTLGTSIQKTKNQLLQTGSDIVNNRKFTLLGDPAMKLAIPENKIVVTAINQHVPTGKDTLKALQQCVIDGKLTDAAGNFLSSFNGTVYPVVYDKPQTANTLGNDANSPITSFITQNNVLYKGTATVKNGLFSCSFIVPKDVSYQTGQGRISLYADNGNIDAAGIFNNFTITASDTVIVKDITGPEIKAYLNDENFVNGGLTDEHPLLLVKLFDSSGINTSGTGIGHDILAVIDSNEQNTIVLNSYYQSEIDSYQRGSLQYQLPIMSEGLHSITVKAWDVANNSSKITLQFRVVKQKKLEISKLYNYPNPFVNNTVISFEHNQPGIALNISMAIFNAMGQKVYQSSQQQTDAGTRSVQLQWNGRSERGEKLQKGVYFYRIIVQSINGSVTAVQKLILL